MNPVHKFFARIIVRFRAWRIRHHNNMTRKVLANQIDDLVATGKPASVLIVYPECPRAGVMWLDLTNPVHVRMALLSFDQGATVAPMLTPAPYMREGIARALFRV